MNKLYKKFLLKLIGHYENKMDNALDNEKAFSYYCKMERAKTKYFN